MEYTDIIYLVSSSIEEDEIGNAIPSSSSLKPCYAKVQSVRINEFYNATMAGLNPNCEFVIKKLNYGGETEIEYNNERYSVIRVVEPKNKYDIVLIVSKKIGVTNG